VCQDQELLKLSKLPMETLLLPLWSSLINGSTLDFGMWSYFSLLVNFFFALVLFEIVVCQSLPLFCSIFCVIALAK
jgi:hypothetical protein